MMFRSVRSVGSSPLGSLSSQQALDLANLYLRNATQTTSDLGIFLVLCHDTKASLSQAKKAARTTRDQALSDGIATAYISLSQLLTSQGYTNEAQAIDKKAEKLCKSVRYTGSTASLMQSLRRGSHLSSDLMDSGSIQSFPPDKRKQLQDAVTIPTHIFVENVQPPVIQFNLPEADERLSSTPQLAHCLGLLHAWESSYDIPDTAQNWVQAVKKDKDEEERLETMAMEVIRAFKRDELKDAKVVAEVVCLAPALSKDEFHELLSEFYTGIEHSGLLKFHLLEGLAQLIQGANPGFLSADDLVKILGLISTRLRETHHQSKEPMHLLTLAVSHVLDAMADTKVIDLDRETLHEPLSHYLEELTKSSDPYLVYHAAYAYQALLCIPDNETDWQTAMRHAGKMVQGVSGLVSAVKSFDLMKFLEGLDNIQKGLEGVTKVVDAVAPAYSDVSSLAESGQGLLHSLKERLSFDRKIQWYSALRGADVLIRDGELVTFKSLIFQAPCRRDPAFQWGVCQRLGEIATNPARDLTARKDAITFLGEMYMNDDVWGYNVSVKQWILNILMQLTAYGPDIQCMCNSTAAEAKLKELEASENKQALYQICRMKVSTYYPLRITMPEFALPSLLDRVQNRPDVEGNIRLMRKQRTSERGNTVYIPPQAKSSLQAANDARFPLMRRVKEFLGSKQKVFLLHGDSGAGKSAFSRELELDLWHSYKKKAGCIPLHINLPSIDKPEHDMIGKQLRKYDFTEAQIREMKHYRKFVLICDGYDETQQTHNLYMSNELNQPGEWDAQMIISCRTEYLGVDYRDRFQPGDRNNQSDSLLFKEAVIMPFSIDQVHEYIRQYVSRYQPTWQVEDYKQALEQIPSLKDLMTNPFLMTLSLDVLPRMVNPGQQHLSDTQVTRVVLYDHFVEQWLERGKKRLGEKELDPQARAIIDRLNDEGFTQNGIDFLKKLAVAIYKEQGGHPVVEYSQFKDEGSWKDAFFLRDDKQLLREACPLRRTGNQHRFIHRSLLEYGLACAVFDPQERRRKAVSSSVTSRRGSMSSSTSIESEDLDRKTTTTEKEPDVNSPLVWGTFVNDQSLLQFLEERAQQEPVFKDQLLAYIELSKKDKKWRRAAANAITILVRAGVQFNGADLKGIRIPRADLSYGLFDSALLQDADLRKVNFRGVWMRQAELTRANMSSSQFGELPYLMEVGWVQACAYSPDGKSFAFCRGNGNIDVHATFTWKKTRTLHGPIGIQRMVFSPNSHQIAVLSGNLPTVQLLDSDSGSLQRTLTGHTGRVNWVAYSPHGTQIASASSDTKIRLWDVAKGDCLRTIHGHGNIVLCVAYSPKGHQIASCGDDATIQLWDVATGECTRVIPHDSSMIAYSPQGDRIASVGKDKIIHLWDVQTGACRLNLAGQQVVSIAFSPKGDQIVSGSLDETVRLWDVDTGLCRQTLTGHGNGVTSVAYSPSGNHVASCSYDSTIRLWDVSTRVSRFVSSGHIADIWCIQCSPKDGMIASSSADKTIRLWDSETGACHKILTGHTNTIFNITYSPGGDQIASAGADCTVRLWDVETGTCLHTLNGHTDRVVSVAYSPRGDVVASAGEDWTVRLWNVATGAWLKTLEGHTHHILGVTYSPDGKWVTSACKDNQVRMWDAVTGECCHILVGHTGWVRDVAYSPRGNQLASSGYDKVIQLWDTKARKIQFTLTGHTDKVTYVAYSPQGDLLASGGWDKSFRIWDVATGQCRAAIHHFKGAIYGIAWQTVPGSTYLATSGGDGSVLKWEVTNEDYSCRVRLVWGAVNGTLNVTGASIQAARGLSSINKQLLSQRGAIDDPEHLFRETGKRVSTMASVVNRLKQEKQLSSWAVSGYSSVA